MVAPSTKIVTPGRGSPFVSVTLPEIFLIRTCGTFSDWRLRRITIALFSRTYFKSVPSRHLFNIASTCIFFMSISIPFTEAISSSLYMNTSCVFSFNSQRISSREAFCFFKLTVCALAKANTWDITHKRSTNVSFIRSRTLDNFPE